MSGFSNPIIGGGGALVYPAIHSPNFDQATSQGWSINKDGDAYFNELFISGDTSITDLYFPDTAFLHPTGDTSGDSDTQRVSSLLADGYRIFLTGGLYYINSTLTLGAGQYIYGAGINAVIVNWLGTGDCFRQYSASSAQTGGGISNLTIDGSSSTAPSAGLHAGDIHTLTYDNLLIQDFTGSDSIGAHFDNTESFTEGLTVNITTKNCTQHVVFDVSGADASTGSFGYADLRILCLADADQDGLVVQNGALLYHSTIRIKGDFPGSSSAVTNAVLRITGSIPAGHTGGNSTVHSSHLEITVECTAGGTYTPQTIVFGTLGSNSLTGCEGILDFGDGASAFTESNFTPTGAPGTFLFEGIVRGDGNLAPAVPALTNGTAPVTAGPKQYGRSLAQAGGASNGALYVNDGDFFKMQLTEDTTISLNPGSAACLAGPQRKTVILIQATSGGPYTVTWPHTGAPSTSSPTVNWAGGTAPTMSSGASETDVYKLETYDGATWYGQAIQNVS